MSTNLYVLMHYSVAYVAVTAFDKIGQYESHHEPVFGKRSDQVARGQGPCCIPEAQPCQDGFANYKIKQGIYI